MHELDNHVEVSPTEARGGGVGRHLFMMLAVSGLAAVALLSGFWILANASH